MKVAVELSAFLFTQGPVLRSFSELLQARLIVFTKTNLEKIACGVRIQRLRL